MQTGGQDANMYIVASFEQSIFLELAISALEQTGITGDQILAVPLDKRTEPRQLFDTLHRADGFSLFDLSAILGTCGMLLGAIYGMVLKWGPILWGLIGLTLGLAIGFLIRLAFVRKKTQRETKRNATAEVFLLIRCNAAQFQMVENILWDNIALGVAKVDTQDLA
jgi:hypothetical protein